MAFMLKKSIHYFPVAPSLKWYCYFPWAIFGIYLLSCLLWYSVVIAEHEDEKEKTEIIDKYLSDLVIIGVCLLLLSVMLIFVRDFKWVHRLEKR